MIFTSWTNDLFQRSFRLIDAAQSFVQVNDVDPVLLHEDIWAIRGSHLSGKVTRGGHLHPIVLYILFAIAIAEFDYKMILKFYRSTKHRAR